MANYSTLKAAVADVVKANGTRAITGANLQAVLLSIINSVGGGGYIFKGVATPSTNAGTPDENVFYIASQQGTYVNFGNIVLTADEVAVLKYNGSWTKETTGIATADKLGIKEIRFNTTQGQPHSSTLDRVNVDIKAGESFIIQSTSANTYNNNVAIFADYSDGTRESISDITPYNEAITLTASKDIVMLGVYISSAASSATVSKIVYYSTSYIARGAFDGYNALRANAMILDDMLNNSYENVIEDIEAKTITFNDKGVRVFLYGKRLVLQGTFVINYANSGNGAWVLDMATVQNAQDGDVITLDNTKVFYAGWLEKKIKNNIILFTCYFGRMGSGGVLGELLLKKNILNDRIFTGIIAPVNALSAVTDTIYYDNSRQVVVVKKEGFRLVFSYKWCIVAGSSDFEMQMGTTNYENGGWFLKRSAVLSVANGGTIELSSTNIYYEKVSSSTFATKGDLLLCYAYYTTITPVGLFGPYLNTAVTPALLKQNAFNSTYNDTDITAKCKQYSAMLNNSGEAETLVFMTDPHLLGATNTFNETTFKTYIGLLQKYYNMLPVDWMVCGGDWLNSGDYQDAACWKLGYTDATMRKLFKHYYPLLGNHDTNYQGVVSASDSSRGDLTQQTLVNLMFRENGNTYYEWMGNNTRFFVFDTQLDWDYWMNDFKREQIDWFGTKLLTNTSSHIIVLQHMYYYSGTNMCEIAEQIQTICGAFNGRQSVTLNSKTYNYASATGTIHCIIAGHSHQDAIITNSNVPVWLTTNMQDGSTPTFDLLLVDYTANELKSVRVGTGSDRTMTLA